MTFITLVIVNLTKYCVDSLNFHKISILNNMNNDQSGQSESLCANPHHEKVEHLVHEEFTHCMDVSMWWWDLHTTLHICVFVIINNLELRCATSH